MRVSYAIPPPPSTGQQLLIIKTIGLGVLAAAAAC
jgi:hypothetical protein